MPLFASPFAQMKRTSKDSPEIFLRALFVVVPLPLAQSYLLTFPEESVLPVPAEKIVLNNNNKKISAV